MRFIVNGPLAYVEREPADPLAAKLIRLLLIHNAARQSAPTRLPGIALAIESVRARLLAIDAAHLIHRKAA